jgi:bisphosphoglycerate-independent phosphoglycerate mutase (AlkP superfamily)
MFYGPGISRGLHVSESTNLNIAPTLLTLLGLPVPEEMKGRVLSEVLD